jgi:hypothetical protein
VAATKLWIDDVRPKPNDDWLHVISSEDAIKMLIDYEFDEISFDHDLGGDDVAYLVALWIEAQAYAGKLKPMKWKVHSANPVGKANIEAAMRRADEYWNQAPRVS